MKKITQLLPAVLMGLLALAATPLHAQANAGDSSEWTPLFNGKDLDGWVQRGGKAKYSVENGEIVGTAVSGTPNSFICPPKNYGNFELELEFKCDPDLNSGVQIRSEVKKIKDREQPFGYQVEIDMSAQNNRWWTAGIYDEGRRGWLFPGKDRASEQAKAFTKQGAEVSKQNEWNTLRIVASGDSIQTFLNGTPRATLKDGKTKVGLIGLQVHSVGKSGAGKQVRFRNVRIKEGPATPKSIPPTQARLELVAGPEDNKLSAAETAAGWKLLFNGKDSSEWRSVKREAFPGRGWEIKNGIFSVLSGGHGGDIMTGKRYSSFELVWDFQITAKANSGIKYLVQTDVVKNSGIGLEYQILDDLRHPDAKLHDNTRTVGGLYDLIAPDAKKPPVAPGEWHTARLVVDGSKVAHYLDGVKIVEYDRHSDAFRALVKKSKYKTFKSFGEWADGHILLQDHHDTVSYKNIKIREIVK
jgi:hypothetical protein